jgi:lysophospholipase L1-like esterase
VCAGDSITHGIVSANYVEMLSDRFTGAGVEFINAGINGNLAYNLLQRLDSIIACRPDIVTLLIGTNDVNATFSQEWEDLYRKEQNLPERPTLAWYRHNVERIVDRLRAETQAEIVLLDLPMLGEDLTSPINQTVRQYNVALRAIAAERQMICLPLHERLTLLLPESHAAPPYEGKSQLMASAAAKHLLLQQSWNRVSAGHGLVLLTDHVHLNERAAAAVAELIGEQLVTMDPSLRIISAPPAPAVSD